MTFARPSAPLDTFTEAEIEQGFRTEPQECRRCGGAGGYHGWPGFTCYRCGGSGQDPKDRKIYTPDRAAELERRAERRAERKAEKERKELEAAHARIEADHPEAARALREIIAEQDDLLDDRDPDAEAFDYTWEEPLYDRWGKFLVEVARKFHYEGFLTDKMAEAAVRAYNDRIAREAEAENAPDEIDAPSGRHEITGEIVSRQFRDSQWGGAFKLLIRVDTNEGFYKVWVTEPKAARRDNPEGLSEGETVTLTATLEPKEPGFAIGKQPTL